jgi:hypothetical protein
MSTWDLHDGGVYLASQQHRPGETSLYEDQLEPMILINRGTQ